MKLLNDPQIETSLRAMERATARTHDVCQSAREGRRTTPPTAARATPTSSVEVATPKAAAPSRTPPLGVRLGVRLGVGVAGGLLMSMAGCPRLPPVSGCTVGTMRCEGDRPRVCSASQRWEPAGDRPCSAVGGVCVVNAAGTAHCDGGPR